MKNKITILKKKNFNVNNLNKKVIIKKGDIISLESFYNLSSKVKNIKEGVVTSRKNKLNTSSITIKINKSGETIFKSYPIYSKLLIRLLKKNI